MTVDGLRKKLDEQDDSSLRIITALKDMPRSSAFIRYCQKRGLVFFHQLTEDDFEYAA